ncbi:ABC transporter ATP-binding protein, partial [Pseudomonas aeruginosa]
VGCVVICEYVGGYQDYLTQKARKESHKPKADKADNVQKTQKPKITPPKTEQKRKLSYKEQRELDGLPIEIASLETEQHEL